MLCVMACVTLCVILAVLPGNREAGGTASGSPASNNEPNWINRAGSFHLHVSAPLLGALRTLLSSCLLPSAAPPGDWEAVGHMMAMHGLGGYYDIILTAETIYSRESQARLLSCIKQVRRLTLDK